MNTATVILLIVGRIFAPSLPEAGEPVIYAQAVTEEQCHAMQLLPMIKSGESTLIGEATCGSVKDWGIMVQAHDCYETVVNSGPVRIVRCHE